MIILTDVDGVLADFVGGICRALAEAGIGRTPESILHWDLKESLSPVEARIVHEAMSAPGFCHALEQYDGASQFVSALRGFADVHAVTAPFHGSPTWMQERVSWLGHLVPSGQVHFVGGRHKHLVRGDILVEDHPETARAWADAHPNGLAILLDRPWNSPKAKEFWPHPRMVRVHGFGHALEVIQERA